MHSLGSDWTESSMCRDGWSFSDVGSLPSCQLPGIVCRAFTEKWFLQCYQEAHQAVFGGFEVTRMVDFLMLQLRGALQESRMENVPVLRRCVAAGHVMFHDLYKVVSELLPIWISVREFVRFSGPRQVKCEAHRVIIFPFLILCAKVVSSFYGFCFFVL